MDRIIHANGVVTYTFPILGGQPVVAHVSTRHGGVSPEPWRSLNFSILRGDTRERVLENRRRLGAAVGCAGDRLVRCQQVHGTGIAKVDQGDAGAMLEGCDGLMTDTPGLPITVVCADCVPLLLYDPVHRALSVCHAGWRGTVNGAALAALWAMQAAFDTEPRTVTACIGPAIGPESYEVGDEVWNMAQAKLPDADRFFSYPNGADRNPHFNLWAANQAQLLAAGVPATRIEVSGIDTAQHTDDFFSHRAEQGRCGLFCLVAWIAEP